ncbi:MAG: hypothetical protein ACKPCM_11825 [Pseudanabaena sp.]
MSTSDWRLQPLRSFWQGVNWENQAIAPVVVNATNSNGSYPALSFLMPVRQYFRSIPWNGVHEIAATVHQPETTSTIEESSETLENFLDDISKFF